MSKLSEQLRDTLTPDEQGNIHLSHGILASIPVLLTEHEKLEREAEATKVLVSEIEKIAPTTDARGSLDFLVYQYRTACEK